MRVLYAAYRYDPRNADLSSGADYNFFSAIQREKVEVWPHIPPLGQNNIIERGLKRFHKRAGKRYAKFPLAQVWRASYYLSQKVKSWQPDVIFSIFPPPLVFYKGVAPCVFRLDTTFWGWQQEYPEFSRLGLYLSLWQEIRAFARCTRIITHSEWTKNILTDRYKVDARRIDVFANPAALPTSVIPEELDIENCKRLENPLRLLFVGKDYRRKGLDIAQEIVGQLNARGVSAELIVCGGPKKENRPHIHYAGFFRKSNAQELRQYAALYERAHLLIHPARFDPSPIATSEAAAFAVPTITNASGGIATSVKDGVSGIVLPRWSPPDAYVAAIVELVNNPARYYALCASSRQRYRQELNWQVAGKKLVAILKEAASTGRST